MTWDCKGCSFLLESCVCGLEGLLSFCLDEDIGAYKSMGLLHHRGEATNHLKVDR